MRNNTPIPKGVRVFPPREAARRRHVAETLLGVFRRWGFREVMTPTFEYLEVFSQWAGEEMADRIFKFVDRQTGRLLGLRSDPTPQVARMVATTLRHHPLPLRLCYVVPIFRYEDPQSGRQQELVQVGVELIGLDKPEADAEMIAMAVEGCQEIGLSRFQIDVGQVNYVRGIIEGLRPPAEVRRQLVAALRRKDAAGIEILLDGIPGEEGLKEAILALPTLYGRKEILASAERLARTPRAKEAVANLVEVYAVLEHYGLAEHVIIDLGEAVGFDYHTGVFFGAYARGLGAPLSAGGRYDQLIGQFGYPCPATGFAFDLDRILEALEGEGKAAEAPGADVLIIDFNPDKRQALRIARVLRQRGLAVARDIIKRELTGSLDYARAANIPRAIIIGGAGLPADRLAIRDLAADREEVVEIEAFCARAARGDLPWPT